VPLLLLLLLLGPPNFQIILFLSTTLLTGMTGISLHTQWSLTPQLHCSFLKENIVFCYGSNLMPIEKINEETRVGATQMGQPRGNPGVGL
jgi:hypothetical protein